LRVAHFKIEEVQSAFIDLFTNLLFLAAILKSNAGGVLTSLSSLSIESSEAFQTLSKPLNEYPFNFFEPFTL
jgi:hypothetical protein